MKFSSASNFYNYFKDCYKLDNKEFTLTNVFHQKYQFTHFLQHREQLLNNELPYTFFDYKKVEELEKELQLHALEKELYYACFFIIGKTELNGFQKDDQICCPLVLFPCEIIARDEDKFVKIIQEDFIINNSVINKLTDNDEKKTELKNRLYRIFSKPVINTFELQECLKSYEDLIDISELPFYPENKSIKDIREQVKQINKNSKFKMISASATILIEKSLSSTKVVSDLEGIAKQNKWSSALEQLLTSTDQERPKRGSLLEPNLNAQQLYALNNSYQFNNSVINGPPGNGKSYTVTAIAVDALLNNETVLIVSKTKEAVKVLRNNLVDDYKLKDIIVSTTSKRFHSSFNKNIKQKISTHASVSLNNGLSLEKQQKNIEKLKRKIEKFIEIETEFAQLLSLSSKSIKEIFRLTYLKLFTYKKETIIKDTELFYESLAQFQKSLKEYIPVKLRQMSNASLRNHKLDLSAFSRAISNYNFSSSQSNLEKLSFENILSIYPIWLVHLPEVNTYLPQTPELFDLVIIDEATQCDIAMALPAIHRAKRVVICGDPNQLRHYSFVSRKQQERLAKKYELPDDGILDYRNTSILDLYLTHVPTHDQITLLTEHYRSTQSLIAFNNDKFYNNQLQITKATPEFTNTSQFSVSYVEGIRNKQGINEVEAKALIQKLENIVKNQEQAKSSQTLGIISPFAKQAEYINSLLRELFPLETLKKHAIFCGTPYQFQGSERDVILISFCVDNDSHHSAFRHLNKLEVFNVATSRAKQWQHVFTSVDRNKLDQETIFCAYLSFLETYTPLQKQLVPVDNDFQREVKELISELTDSKIYSNYQLIGQTLDIFFKHNHQYYCIDLFGEDNTLNIALPLETYKTLKRIKITAIPLAYRFWTKDKVKAIKVLKALIFET